MRVVPLFVLLAGCAAVPPPSPPPHELLLAQRALARAEDAPFADLAEDEIAEAEARLTVAERACEESPGSAVAADDAYVAWRAAEKAWIAGRYAAAREALFKARRAAARLAADLARREAFFASLERRRAAQAEARADLRRAHLAALHRSGARVIERSDALVARFAAEELFLPGTSLFRDGGEARIDALCRALRGAPPFELKLAIADDMEGFRAGPALLALRRYERLCEAMRARGMPPGALLPRAPHPPPGAQVDVVVIAPDPPLPPDD